MNTPEDFWGMVNRGTIEECWWWRGPRSKGYGRVQYEGRCAYAHRTAYAITFSGIPAGMDILHSCDEPLCCNPSHLRPGTDADNFADRKDRSRHWADRGSACIARGIEITSSVIDDDIVRLIRLERSRGVQILSIATSIGAGDGTPAAARTYVERYVGLASHALLDLSGGTGREVDAAWCATAQRRARRGSVRWYPVRARA